MAGSPHRLLRARVEAAAAEAFGADVTVPEPLVVPTTDPRHGDFTSPVAMALAGALRQPPHELARRLADALDVTGVAEAPEVVRPGFVNLRLTPTWLADRVGELVGDDRLGLEPAAVPRRVVIDYSGPNVAKAMHVGHLRSTIIGDSLANMAELAGHDVERVNHVGDWGTQFGMLLALLDEVGRPGDGDAPAGLAEAEDLYRRANARFAGDEEFRARARRRVVELQSGEAGAQAMWRRLVALSMAENQAVYDRLGVRPLEVRGESTYQPMLAEVVADLEAAGLVVVDDGAKCVFVDGFTNSEG